MLSDDGLFPGLLSEDQKIPGGADTARRWTRVLASPMVRVGASHMGWPSWSLKTSNG
jgi:hypothetical protein